MTTDYSQAFAQAFVLLYEAQYIGAWTVDDIAKWTREVGLFCGKHEAAARRIAGVSSATEVVTDESPTTPATANGGGLDASASQGKGGQRHAGRSSADDASTTSEVPASTKLVVDHAPTPVFNEPGMHGMDTAVPNASVDCPTCGGPARYIRVPLKGENVQGTTFGYESVPKSSTDRKSGTEPAEIAASERWDQAHAIGFREGYRLAQKRAADKATAGANPHRLPPDDGTRIGDYGEDVYDGGS